MVFKRILITSGPTAVPVDDMRIISNRSTGEMGRLIAAGFFRLGYRVTLLEGRGVATELPLSKAITLKKFFYYDELCAMLAQELRRGYDVVVHAAAVSDFRLKRPLKGKMSSGRAMTLALVPTEKLIEQIKVQSPKTLLVGFKLETALTRAFIIKKVKGLFAQAHCDLVVANRQSAGEYEAYLIEPSGQMSSKVSHKEDLVKVLVQKIGEMV